MTSFGSVGHLALLNKPGLFRVTKHESWNSLQLTLRIDN